MRDRNKPFHTSSWLHAITEEEGRRRTSQSLSSNILICTIIIADSETCEGAAAGGVAGCNFIRLLCSMPFSHNDWPRCLRAAQQGPKVKPMLCSCGLWVLTSACPIVKPPRLQPRQQQIWEALLRFPQFRAVSLHGAERGTSSNSSTVHRVGLLQQNKLWAAAL